MTTQKRLERSIDDKWIGGVCGGLAEYTGVDANLIRILVVLATVLGFGSLIVAYVVAWLLMPQAQPRPIGPATPPAPEPPSE
jgi:phage shock protein PspC (stress-responsive transcriptional regulator)